MIKMSGMTKTNRKHLFRKFLFISVLLFFVRMEVTKAKAIASPQETSLVYSLVELRNDGHF